MGIILVLIDKLITCVKGLAKVEAASFSSPGGRLPSPVVFFRLRLQFSGFLIIISNGFMVTVPQCMDGHAVAKLEVMLFMLNMTKNFKSSKRLASIQPFEKETSNINRDSSLVMQN